MANWEMEAKLINHHLCRWCQVESVQLQQATITLSFRRMTDPCTQWVIITMANWEMEAKLINHHLCWWCQVESVQLQQATITLSFRRMTDPCTQWVRIP